MCIRDRANAEKYDVANRITFEQCSCLSNFEYFQHAKNQFSAIVSNPPYVPTSVIEELPENVRRFEPMVALDGGADGLGIFREIVLEGRTLLDVGGLMLLELHETCLEIAKEFAIEAGLNNVSIMKDLAGKNRYLAAVA